MSVKIQSEEHGYHKSLGPWPHAYQLVPLNAQLFRSHRTMLLQSQFITERFVPLLSETVLELELQSTASFFNREFQHRSNIEKLVTIILIL